MNSIRKKRLVIILIIGSALSLATFLILYALSSNINLFYTPSQLSSSDVTDKTIRLGGMVVKNSVTKSTGNTLDVIFSLTDGQSQIKVKYSGILPDLFREGQGIVALGQLKSDGHFQASQVLAKHDEKYMPPEVKQAMKKNL